MIQLCTVSGGILEWHRIAGYALKKWYRSTGMVSFERKQNHCKYSTSWISTRPCGLHFRGKNEVAECRLRCLARRQGKPHCAFAWLPTSLPSSGEPPSLPQGAHCASLATWRVRGGSSWGSQTWKKLNPKILMFAATVMILPHLRFLYFSIFLLGVQGYSFELWT